MDYGKKTRVKRISIKKTKIEIEKLPKTNTPPSLFLDFD